MALLATLFAGCGGVDTSRDEEYAAKSACRHFVDLQLKAPSTADYTDETATRDSAGGWHCTGNVDAENSFGAKIRNAYSVTVEKRADEKWYIVIPPELN